ncbi:MAG: 50S ribosomal protein L2 [Alphaproteobacteria bacterium]|nr:MAG: 50S ribosomal protein L2 [Alphaproteobacteria bacterium]
MTHLKTFSPYTPSTRNTVLVSHEGLWKGRPIKVLTEGLHKSGGRNNLGRMTMRHRGGGHKRLYRVIDFKRQRDGQKATVERIEYDPNRTAHIALLSYADGQKAYIVAPQKLSAGDVVESGVGADIKVGNCLPLSSIPVGTLVHNLELKPQKGAQLVRSAGAFAQIVGRDDAYVQVRLGSGELRMILGACRATIGVVSNPNQKNIKLGKAGRSRWLGRRSSVRGVVMNPVDHPHGGGEGRTSGGRHPVSPWGICTKGKKTRNKKKPSSKYIIRKRKN